MRAAVMIACVGLAACSREGQEGNEVDLNAAASQAQEDIDNYATLRHSRSYRSPMRSSVTPVPVTGNGARR